MDATNQVANNANIAGEALDDTAHIFGDKLKETVEQAGDMGHQAVQTAKETASDMLSGIAHNISSTSQKIYNVGADVAHSLNPDTNKAMNTFKGEFDDITRGILDTAHHTIGTLKNTLQERKVLVTSLRVRIIK